MDKYDIIFEALQEKYNEGELTMEEVIDLNEAAYQKYVVERTTASSIFKDTKVEYKNSIKKIKTYIKNKDNKNALAEINHTKKIIEKAKKEVKSIESTTETVVFSQLKDFAVTLLSASIINYTVQNGPGIGVTVDNLSVTATAIIRAIDAAIKIYKRGDDESIKEALDTTKKQVLKALDECEDNIKSLERHIK